MLNCFQLEIVLRKYVTEGSPRVLTEDAKNNAPRAGPRFPTMMGFLNDTGNDEQVQRMDIKKDIIYAVL